MTDTYTGSSYLDGDTWFTDHHKYAVLWEPGEYVRWYIDDMLLFEVGKEALAEKVSCLLPQCKLALVRLQLPAATTCDVHGPHSGPAGLQVPVHNHPSRWLHVHANSFIKPTMLCESVASCLCAHSAIVGWVVTPTFTLCPACPAYATPPSMLTRPAHKRMGSS